MTTAKSDSKDIASRDFPTKNPSVTIAKGIAIFLMVMGHSGCPVIVRHFIYMFHMPLFFFMSGYCFKNKYLFDAQHYIVNRFKGTWWNYIKFGIIFLMLHNLFYKINIYSNEYGFHGGVSYLYSFQEMALKAFQIIFTMNHCEQLLGGFWFLHSLFWGSVLFYLLIRSHFKTTIWGGAFLLLFTIVLLALFPKTPVIGSREIMASFFIWAGHMYAKSEMKIEKNIYFLVSSFFLVLAGSVFWNATMENCTWYLAVIYMFTAVGGTLMILGISSFVENKKCLVNALTYIGNHTLEILTWHFLCFKLVTKLLVDAYDYPSKRLSEFPVIGCLADKGWWVVYLIVGITLGIIVGNCYNKIEKLIWLHIKSIW